jgi:hypothetical protein
VRRGLVTAGYEVVWSDPKTERSRRSITLDPAALGAVRAHRARQAKEKLALGPASEDQNLVFAQEDGRPMHPERLSKLFTGSVRNAKLPPSGSTTCGIPTPRSHSQPASTRRS